jgi:hypothetical protein
MKSGRVLAPFAAAIGLVVLLTAVGSLLWPSVAAGQTSLYNFGFGAVLRDQSAYSEIGRLHTGWYHRFGTELNPTRPEGMEHVPVVQLHQSKESPRGAYTTPYTYTLTSPSRAPGPLPTPLPDWTDPVSAPPVEVIQAASAVTPPSLCRFGFDAARRSVDEYPAEELARLRTQFYANWGISANPSRPNGMEYIQMVRIKQWKWENGQRVLASVTAPYETPYTYTVTSGWDAVRTAVQNNLGSVWLIGNEIERRDWTTGHQDEILPEVYAWAYHDLYMAIKSWDPTARVSAGGIIQATPLRLQYMDRVWDEYQSKYGERMPVDVWNIHAFVLQEKRNDWGADIPAGIDVQTGILYSVADNKDFNIAAGHIRAFRQWMRDKGEQNKPLYITEYGVNMPPWYSGFSFEAVRDEFMYPSFDFFLSETDADIGYPADDYRLVQMWMWYSLDDDYGYWNDGQWRLYYNGHLFHSGLDDGRPPMGIAPLGQYWEAYVTDPSISVPDIELAPVRMWQEPAPSSMSAPMTVTLYAQISNSGGISAAQPFAVEFWNEDSSTVLVTRTVNGLAGFGETAQISVTWPNLSAGTHHASVRVDTTNAITECNETNNQMSEVVLVGTERVFLPLIMKKSS